MAAAVTTVAVAGASGVACRPGRRPGRQQQQQQRAWRPQASAARVTAPTGEWHARRWQRAPAGPTAAGVPTTAARRKIVADRWLPCPAEEPLVATTRASKPSTPEEEALVAQIQLHESWAAGARSSAGSSPWRGPELLQAYDRWAAGCTLAAAMGMNSTSCGVGWPTGTRRRQGPDVLRLADACRCGDVTSEYAKTFFLGTQLMTPEQAKAIWAIYVWCR